MKTWVLVALLVLTVALLTVVVTGGDNDDRCHYAVAGGHATIELPCGLDAASARTYVGQHPELVAPQIPRLSPN